MNRPRILKVKSHDEIKAIVESCYSNRQLIKKLGYKASGNSQNSIQRKILKLYPDISFSHFKGKGWNKGNYNFNENKSYVTPPRVSTLVAKRGWKCECCGLTKWNEKPIPLQVHHVNGNRGDNRLENLKLLCPNCHAQTNNYCGANTKKTYSKKVTDESFIKVLSHSSSISSALGKLSLSTSKYNYDRAYNLMSRNNITLTK